MSYDVKLKTAAVRGAEQFVTGVAAVYLVNPQTHGDPHKLYERAAEVDFVDGELLVLNTNEIIYARITKRD